jgi:tetratricopeptide (TPR) repeat protein
VLSLYEVGDFDAVIKECEANINRYISDARFYNLCGLAISDLLDMVDETQYSWDIAIKYAKTAYTIAKKVILDKDLQGAVANNLAYFYYRRDKPGDLDSADSFIKELRRTNPSFYTIPEFLHTVGCVLKGKALNEKNKVKQGGLKAESLENLQKAYDLAKENKLSKSKIEKYANDLHDAEKKFGDLGQ